MKLIFIFLLSFFMFNIASAQTVDTLFIRFENKDLIRKRHKLENYVYYLPKNSGNNGQFYFIEKSKTRVKQQKRGLNFQKLIENNDFYSGKNNKTLLDDWKLWSYFENIKVFLVKKNCIYELEAQYVIQ